MKIRIMTLLASAALAMPAAAVAAEVPQRGMSEARVRADFGSPSSVRGPVGSPAITRWNYDGFTVYFENGISLHTVVDRPATAAPDVVSGTQELPAIEETTAEAEQEPQAAPESTAPPMFDPVTGSFVGAETKEEAPSPQAPAATESPEPKAPEQAAEPAPEPEPAPQPPASTAEQTPEAVAEPAADAESSEPPPADGEFRFDPVTGRIIISGEPAPKQAAAEKQQTVKQQAEDAEQQAEQATADAQQKVSEAEQNVDAEVQEKTDEAEQKAEQAEEESQGGFSIDWDARR
ncbi:hypothetical protein [Alcanivorax sp.]|mgnify:CR=1 FL=1|uniref:hypothetical protein n=1 Tax=Alcanivorax sp. TaxID=1872427 RepID=UPI0025C032AC|nr:hypothetical protein [Alcanivorax sp.]